MARWYQNTLTGQKVEVTSLKDDDFYAQNPANWARIDGPTPDPAADEDDGEEVDLTKLTKAGLIKLAKDNDIDLSDAGTKAEMIQVIADAYEAFIEDDDGGKE